VRRTTCLAAALVACAVSPIAPAVAQEPGRILVMPFENVTRDSRILWLSEASSVLLADDLNALGAGAISREERRIAFDRLRVPPAAALTDATVIRIGELLGASAIITGSLTLDGDDLVVEARRIVLDSARAERLAPQRGPLPDLFAIFERVARLVALSTPVTERTGKLERPPVAAFENYIKGLVAETPSTALGYLNGALAADPIFAAPRLALWDVYTGQGEHERALAAVRLVPGDAPVDRRARFLEGLSFLSLDRHGDARDVFEALAAEEPSASVLNNVGVARLRAAVGARTEDAAHYFRRAVDADANHADSFFNLGYATWLNGDVRAAVYWLRETVRRNPADGDAHFLLSLALAADGNGREGNRERELAERLSSVYAEWEQAFGPSHVPDRLERVRQDVELPGARWVEDLLATAGQRDQRELAGFHLERARRHYGERRDREAADDVNRSLFLDPYQGEAHLLAARIHLRGGRPAEAIDALRIAAWSAETAEVHAVLAEAYLAAGDRTEARRSAERALALDPGAATARDVLRQIGSDQPSPP
jgi:tetratricopeptide (TPR) repeat protein